MIPLRTASLALFACCCPILFAQSPLLSPTASAPPKSLVDSLAPTEIEEAIRTLKSNFVDPNALKDQEINRATLEGLLARWHGGAVLIPGKAATESPEPFFSDVLANHIEYIRMGSLTPDNLSALDKALVNFGNKKVDALVLDLRGSVSNSEFDLGAEVARRFAPKGATLWTLHKPAVRQDQTFTNDRDPLFQGTTMVLVDSETSGVAEAIAAALKTASKALVIGQSTAGRAVEYADFRLASGKILRLAVGELIGPDGHSLFPGGVKPDLVVEMSLAQKRQIFVLSQQRGMAPFVFESERPHFNEAALIAGTNPELEARQARRNPDDNLHDTVVQRAVDVITSLGVFQKQ